MITYSSITLMQLYEEEVDEPLNNALVHIIMMKRKHSHLRKRNLVHNIHVRILLYYSYV